MSHVARVLAILTELDAEHCMTPMLCTCGRVVFDLPDGVPSPDEHELPDHVLDRLVTDHVLDRLVTDHVVQVIAEAETHLHEPGRPCGHEADR